jgi:hypothetical protein
MSQMRPDGGSNAMVGRFTFGQMLI